MPIIGGGGKCTSSASLKRYVKWGRVYSMIFYYNYDLYVGRYKEEQYYISKTWSFTVLCQK
jgi:hypothetical protein